MKVRLFGIFTIAVGMLCATVLSAQNLPLMPGNPAVKSAVFSNGLSCYLAENKTISSIADFMLIRRDYEGNDLVMAKKDVIVSSETVLDSLLISFMRRIEKDKAPADHALVISGDIDAASVMMKLKYMSLMVDGSVSSPHPEYEWDGNGKAEVSVVTDSSKCLSTVHLEWEAPRVAFANMNTIQSAVYEKLAWELGEVACSNIKRGLRKHGIPYAEVSCALVLCQNAFAHDSFAFDVTVAPQDAEAARNITTSVLATLDQGEVRTNDLILSEREYLHMLEKSVGYSVLSNEDYTALCRSAFLYNRPLSTDIERLSFFTSKSVSEASRLKMFSGVASALIDVDMTSDTVAMVSSGVTPSDTLGFPGPSALKTKIRSTRKDSFSGGSVWTFTNGFKVIYRRMPSADGRLHYSMSLNGGYGNVEDLKRGEGAYMSDYLDCCWIAGMKGSDFKELLSLSGMSMDAQVNLFNTVISGYVDNENVPLLMKALLAVANESRPDAAQIEYYTGCEKLRQAARQSGDVRAEIDAIMCPGYRYTSFKTDEGVREGTFTKAESLFSMMTSKMNDGVLVLVGDVAESDLKKTLQLYVGDFKVKNVASRRPSVSYHAVTGWSSCLVEGDEAAVAVAVSAPLSMTSVNHFASEMAAMMLERRIRAEFEPYGVTARVFYLRSMYPEERFSVMVELGGNCRPEYAAKVRKIISACSDGISSEELAAYKGYVKNTYAQRVKSEEYWLKVMPLRHLEGKDFTTGYSAKIDAVTSQTIQNIFKALDEGAGVEYITTKK